MKKIREHTATPFKTNPYSEYENMTLSIEGHLRVILTDKEHTVLRCILAIGCGGYTTEKITSIIGCMNSTVIAVLRGLKRKGVIIVDANRHTDGYLTAPVVKFLYRHFKYDYELHIHRKN